jgi:hypothetical protein
VTRLTFNPSQVGGGPGTMSNTHFGQEVGDIVLDRLLGQKEIISDFLVGLAGGDLLKDVSLAVG